MSTSNGNERISLNISKNEIAEKFDFPSIDARSESDKKAMFERRITHRIRLSRMACVQALYMFVTNLESSKLSNKTQRSLFDVSNEDVKPDIFCRSVIYIYKNYILGKKSYGDNIKNKKIDENFLFDIVECVHQNKEAIDKAIGKHLSIKWSVDNLDFTIKSILQCAIAESILFPAIETAILTSEYTNLATYFFQGKQIGFINGVLQSYCLDRKKEKAKTLSQEANL